jgi:3-methyl-2-oxobutanoate hydroxymethyltransferase
MSRITVKSLLQMKQKSIKIAMMTAYDFPTASILDTAGIHILLVGDSLGMVVQGRDTTLPVTLEHMIYHAEMVSRASKQAMVVADMPFMTGSVSVEDTLRQAGRLMQESGCHAVKIEGGERAADSIRRLVQAGIPVMGHIGLTPQSVHALGGFAVQGRTEKAALRLMRDALALEEAGAFAVVLEAVPEEVAGIITSRLTIPTIGIGAGVQCDGQVLVFHDMVGYTSGYIPKHNKRYLNMAELIASAAKSYIEEVQNALFPGIEQTVHLREEEASVIDAMKKEE